jgi:probable O-glycosylation ligase (exosortase A-associated)
MGGQVLVAVMSTGLAVMLWLVAPDPFVPLLGAVGLASLAAALRQPAWALLAFVIFSVFRIHEVLPVLLPLQIPLALSVLGLASVAWHICLTRSIKPYLSPELRVFLVFAIVISFDVLAAKSYPLAYSYWSENLLKLVVITFALAWTLRRPVDFRAATYLIVLSGILVGAVTIHNKLNGIGLVELTRATVARNLGSPLGDPNILALTLIFSLSFCISLLFSRTRTADFLLGLVGTVAVVAGVICTQSRGGLLGVLAVFAVGAIRIMKFRTGLLLIVPLVAVPLYTSMDLSDRVSGGAADLSDESAEGRLDAWTAAIHMAVDRPLTGVGINNFTSQFYNYSDVWLPRPLTAHSIWFQALGESGIVGCLLFVVMVFLTFRSAIRARQALRRSLAPPDMQDFIDAVLAGLAGFCIAGSFLSEAYDWELYVLLAFSSAAARWARASFEVPEVVMGSQPALLSEEALLGTVERGTEQLRNNSARPHDAQRLQSG